MKKNTSTSECLDVLDEHGAPTGLTVSKEVVHRRGDWFRTAHVWVVMQDGHLILQRRSPSKTSYPGMLDISAAGHVSAGETCVEAAVRELKEELGLTATAEQLERIATVRSRNVTKNGTYISNEHSEVYVFAWGTEFPKTRFKDGEVTDIIAVTLEELEARVQAMDPELVPHPEEYKVLIGYLRAKRGLL